jgi:antitoxin MazE
VKSTVKRWGNSLAVRLPKDIARTLELDEGSDITLEIVEDGLLVKFSKPQHSDLEALLHGVTRETIHDETDWGDVAGKEAW